MQGLLPGSVSKYCLQQSPIPVVVVRPTTKREKKKKKRQADPSRRSYGNILQISEQQGSGLFNTEVGSEANVAKIPADEAAAVAEAVGLPRHFQHAHTGSDSKLSITSSNTEEDNAKEAAIRAETPQLSPEIEDENGGRVLKSPGLGNLESPPESESESETESRGRDRTPYTDTTSPEISPTNIDKGGNEDIDEDISTISNRLQLADAS